LEVSELRVWETDMGSLPSSFLTVTHLDGAGVVVGVDVCVVDFGALFLDVVGFCLIAEYFRGFKGAMVVGGLSGTVVGQAVAFVIFQCDLCLPLAPIVQYSR
jgi:hypothetical protein